MGRRRNWQQLGRELARTLQQQPGTVYLLCFSQDGQPARYRHAGHYLGWASDLPARLSAHLAGRGARLVEVVVTAGLDVQVVATWEGPRALEQLLKRQHNNPRLCPRCQKERERTQPQPPTVARATPRARGGRDGLER